jgi:hypothetical protein
MMKRYFVIIGVIAMFCIAAGCAQPLTRLEMDYGTSFKLAKFNQIMYPDAEKNLAPVTGLGGRAAQAIMERYWKDFGKAAPEAPAVPATLIMGVGGK